jgi:tetratricopeptide (TPR) repeat protein
MSTSAESSSVDAEASLEKAGRFDELIRLCEARARGAVDAAEAAHQLCRAATLAREQLRNPLRAEELLRRALAYQPTARAALEGLLAVAEGRGDAAGQLEALERLAHAVSGADAAALFLRAGALAEATPSQRDRALVAFQLAMRADPQDRRGYRKARAVLLADGRYAGALDILERERAALGDAELLEEYLALAEALVLVPQQHALATKALVHALAMDGKSARAQAAQKELAKLEYTWRDRVKQLKADSLAERDRRAAARLSLRVAQLYAFYEPTAVDKLKEALDRCFALWPAMPDALDLLEHTAEKAGDLRIALAVFSRLAGDARDKQARCELFLRIGRLQLTKLDDRAQAAASFESACAEDPSNPEVAQQASELLIELGRKQDAVALLERHLETLKDRHAQVALRLTLSDLRERLLRDLPGARAQAEEASKLDPHNPLVAWRLATLCADQGALDGLWPVLDLAVSAPRSVEERIELCELTAMLCEDARDPERVFRALLLALPIDPTREALLGSLKEAATRAGLEAELVDALRREAQRAPAAGQAERWRALGRYLQAIEQLADAQDAWREVLQRVPADAEAQAAVEALAVAQTRAPPDPRARLAAEAHRLEASGADPAAAAAVYRKLLELDPDSVATMKKLAGVATSLSRWGDLAAVAERIVASSRDASERGEWRARLAQVLAEHLDRREDAAALLLSLVAEGDERALVVSGLERLAAQRVRPADIGRALASVYARAGDHQRQLVSLLAALEGSKDADERQRLLVAAAELSERHLADVRGALELTLRALRANPADEALRLEVLRLARLQQAEPEVAAALAGIAREVGAPALAAALAIASCELWEAVGWVEDAEAALAAAASSAGDHPALLSRLGELHARARRWDACDAVLRRLVGVAEPGAQGALWVRIADVNVARDRPREAAEALQAAIECGADEREHLPRLAQLLEADGQLAALTGAQARLIALAEAAGDRARAAELSHARARVLAQLGDVGASLARYAELLAQDPADPEAMAALEAALADPAHGEAAARAMLPPLEAAGDHRRQVAALAVIAAAARAPGERVAALRRAAALQAQQLQQPDQAFAALASALRLAPGDAALLAEARAAAEQAEAVDSYAEVLEELVEETPSPALHLELAQVYEACLAQIDAALRHLAAALALDPSRVEALRALSRLHRARGEWRELLAALERLAVVEEPSASEAGVEREVALIAEQQLGDLARAAASWARVAERAPADREAAAALDRLYSALDQPRELAAALELRRTQVAAGPEARELACRLAALRRAPLGDPRGALELYRQVLGEEPAHPAAWAALEGWAMSGEPEAVAAAEVLEPALAERGEHQKRVALREARRAHAADVAEQTRLATEIRGILERDLGQHEAAFMQALKAFTDGLDREGVQPELERLARETGSFSELAEIYEATAEELGAGDAQGLVLLRRAAELREQLGEGADAQRLWRQLLDRAPDDRDALARLSTMYEASRDARQLAQVYARQAQLAETPGERLSLWLKSAEASESSGELEHALDSLQRARAIEASPQVLEPMERVLARARRVGEQAEVLQQLAELAVEPGARAATLTRLGQLLEREGQAVAAARAWSAVLEVASADPEAVAGLERLLDEEPARLEAARRLEAVYRERSDLRRLIAVLDVKLEALEPGRRVPVLLELATLREAIGQQREALTVRIRAFTEAPDDVEVREELERLCAELGAQQELAAVYEDALERGVAEPLAGALWRRLAELVGDDAERRELAVRAWREVLGRAPGDATALSALKRLYRAAGQPQGVAAVLRHQLAGEASPAAQLDLLLELAAVSEEALDDLSTAAQCYRSVLERSPSDATANERLAGLLDRAGQWPELAALLGRQVQLAETTGRDEEALGLLVRLGQLKLTRLGDPQGALVTFQEALRRKPAHAGAVGALEAMARSDNPLKGEAAATLEPLFEGQGDHFKLVQMLEARVGTEPEVAERAALLRRIAEVYAQQMDNAEMAFVAAARALREQPDEAKSLELALALFTPADAEDEMIALLAEVAPRATADAARAGLYRALARLHAMADDEAAAIEAWRRVTELAPTDAEAMQQLGGLLSRQGRAQDLLDVLKRQLTVEEDDARRAALLLQVGTLQEEQLKDPAAALATLRRLIELSPEHAEALSRLDRLCEAQGRWPELADVLARRLKLAPSEEQADVSMRLAVVRETRLLDKAGAIDLYEALLTQNPRHPGALGRLEALVQREPQHQHAFEVLAAACRAGGDPMRLGQLIEGRVAVSPDVAERKALLTELARLREAQSEPELAYLAYYRAYKDEPNDAALREKLVAAGAAAGSWDELAHALEECLPRVSEAAEVAEVCLALAQLCDQRLGEKEDAVAWYEKARRASADVGPRCLPALDRLFGELGAHAQQADAIEALIQLASAPAERVALCFRLGQLAMESLDNPDRAAGAFERVLQVDPRHLPSLRSLEVLYEQAGANEKLFRVLEAQRELVQGPERERVLARMATVSGEGLGDVESSIRLYRELLEKSPRNDQAFEALAGLLDRANRAEELKELLAWKLQFTVDPRELVRLNERLGRVLFERLGQAEAAVPSFKAALERDPRHRGAMEALRDIFEKLGRVDDLVIVLRRLIPVQEEASGVKQIRIKLAEIIARTPRREEALDAARRALEVEPHAIPELERLLAVFSELKAWPDAVRTLELRSQVELQQEEREAAVQSLFKVADLWRGPANKLELAGGALERVLELTPSNRQAYEQALGLYSQLGDWRAYAQVMDRYLPHFVTEDEKVQALRDLAQVQESRLGAKHVAFLQYCRAMQLVPADEATRQQVERLAAETGSYDELAAVYEEIADAAPRGPLAEQLYLTLARVQDSALDDASGAETSLRKILEFDPTNRAALDALTAMFARRGQSKEYIVSLEQKLEAADSLEGRKEILREIARVYDELLGKLDEAEGALVRAAELEPDLDTLGLLVALQRRQQHHADVASTLMRMRDISAEPEARSRLQVEVAQVYERDLGDDEAAVEGYRQALEFDPANVAALDALERLYTKLDRPGELLAVYERQLELAGDYRHRLKILFASAAIWEDRYQNLANADACIEAALQVDPQSLQAITALERLRKAQGRWDELIGVVDRHIQLLSSPQEKAELCVEMGDVFHQQLKVVDRAVTAYHQALELDPSCRSAMHALGTLYERSGNWPFALEMLEREAQALGATGEAVELWFRMGKINEDMLIDPGSARRCYLEALRVDAAYLPAIRGLKGIYEAEQDHGNYEKALVEEARQTEDPQARAAAFVEVGRYYEGQERRDEAAAQYEEALKLQPELLEAARPLADICLATEAWERCEQMLDVVTGRLAQDLVMAPDDVELSRELCRRLYRLGYVAEKNGRRDKALGAYERAYQLDATHLPVLEGYGHLLVQARRLDEAARVYQSILVHHRSELSDLEVAEIHWTLGDIALQGRQLDRAGNHFEKALAIDAGHEPSLRSMVSIAEAQGQWDRAAEFRQRLLQGLEGDARFDAAVQLGALARERLSDPYMAIDAYLAAHRIRPDALDVMDALYVLYRESKQAPKAAELLERMLEAPALKGDPQRARRVWFALGELCRDQLQDVDKAARCFNAALDLDWRFVEAFSALEAMLGRAKRWKALDDDYKRMLARFPKTDETHAARMTLWRALGDLYLNVMKAPEAAVEVYKVVAAGLPDDVEVQELYAGLAQGQPGKEQEALAAWRRALPTTASPGKAASALAELAARRKDYDSAWLAAQVVSGLIGEAGDGEREILSKLTPYAKKREVAQRQLTDRLWAEHLLHPKVRGPLSELMAILFEQAGSLYKEDFTRYGVNPKRHQIDVAAAQEYQVHHYRYVSRLFGMEQIALFSPFLVATRDRMAKRSTEVAPDPMVAIEICHTDPVSLKVGGKFFSETGQKELYYLLGRTMAFLRPELALAQRLSAERLEAVLQAAISLSVDRFRFTADPRAIDAERRQLERLLTQQARDALTRVTRAYVAVATPNDVRNYLEGAELSATRAGAFAAGEIEPVKRMVMAEAGGQYRVQPRSKIRDLLVFALGEDLHALRVAVGTNVEVQVRK